MINGYSLMARMRRGALAAGAGLAVLVAGAGAAGPAQAAVAEAAAKPTAPAQFMAVSCVRPTWCMAVGNAFGRYQPAKDLAEIWNGKSWRLVATPAGAGLASVSCASTRYCLAFGTPPVIPGRVGQGGGVAVERRQVAEDHRTTESSVHPGAMRQSDPVGLDYSIWLAAG